MVLGPLQLLIIGFEEDNFADRILPELRALGQNGPFRTIDILFAKKDNIGKILAVKTSKFTEEEAVRFGSIAGALIGLSISVDDGSKEISEIGYFTLAESDLGSNLKDIAAIIEKIPKDSSFAVVLIEHRWAIKLRETVTDAGGVLLAQGLILPLVLAKMGTEFERASEADDA